MKKIILTVLINAYFGVALAAIPTVNQYRIEKRPTAAEPTPQQYSVAESDETTATKPPFSFYTELNQAQPNELFTIPPYQDAQQLPKIGKWMIAVKTGQKNTVYVPSHWLDDQSAQGQYIIEPINYIFVVYGSDEKTAIKTLTNALVNTGFTIKWSSPAYHSDNYHAHIGGQRVPQLKRADGVFLTFSNNSWLHENDHFRVMGPFKTVINQKHAFLFLSSVSEESAWDNTPSVNAGHFYISFAHARDNLATALIKKGHPTYYVLSNNILDNAQRIYGRSRW